MTPVHSICLAGSEQGFARFPAPAAELVAQSRAQSAPSAHAAMPAAGNAFVAHFPELPPSVQALKATPGHAHKKSADDIMKMFDKPAGGLNLSGPGLGFIPAMPTAYSAGAGSGGFGGTQPPNGFGMPVRSPFFLWSGSSTPGPARMQDVH